MTTLGPRQFLDNSSRRALVKPVSVEQQAFVKQERGYQPIERTRALAITANDS